MGSTTPIFRPLLVLRPVPICKRPHFCNGQGMFLCLMDTPILLIEVDKVRGERQGFLADVRDQFLHQFLDEAPPIHWPCSGKCLEDGVGHSSANSLICDLHLEIASTTFLSGIGIRSSSFVASGIVTSSSYNNAYTCYK